MQFASNYQLKLILFSHEEIFEQYNPDKSVRFFTYVVGRDVLDLNPANWMACNNRGKVFYNFSCFDWRTFPLCDIYRHSWLLERECSGAANPGDHPRYLRDCSRWRNINLVELFFSIIIIIQSTCSCFLLPIWSTNISEKIRKSASQGGRLLLFWYWAILDFGLLITLKYKR